MAESPVKVVLPGENLYGQDCYIQTFTFNDAKKLSLAGKTSDTMQLFTLLNDRISFPVNLLTLQDFWFILHWQRINSYPTYPMRVPWNCPECNHQNTSELSASSLVISDLDKDYKHGLELQFTKESLPIRLALVKDEIEVYQLLKKRKDLADNPEAYQGLMTAGMLESGGGSLLERYEYVINNFTPDDDFLIQLFQNEFDYGVKDYAEFNCLNCEEVSKVRFQFNLTSFFPSVRDSSNVRSRILSLKTPLSTDRESGGHGFGEDNLHQGTPPGDIKETGRNEQAVTSKDKEEIVIQQYPEFENR